MKLPLGDTDPFRLITGSERKTTGSYYTPRSLVNELIQSALVPVVEERLAMAKTREEREHAILSMRVIDPAAGSGHFLLAAARRMGRELARVRTDEAEPGPSAFRHAVRDVIRSCIYAVDKNPLAVDLCKVALWLEGHNPGLPLNFLDHHVRCGDSLVGVLPHGDQHTVEDVLREGIPDGAFKPVEGDDKKVASALKRANREQRENRRQYRLSWHPALWPAAPASCAIWPKKTSGCRRTCSVRKRRGRLCARARPWNRRIQLAAYGRRPSSCRSRKTPSAAWK